jgi:hypothetical protein
VKCELGVESGDVKNAESKVGGWRRGDRHMQIEIAPVNTISVSMSVLNLNDNSQVLAYKQLDPIGLFSSVGVCLVEELGFRL